MRKIMLMLMSSVLVTAVAGCSMLGVYRIDIPQGTPLTQSQVNQLKLGMTQQQVRYLLGSPSLTDSLNPQRWDYVYHYTPGTYAKQAGLNAVQDQHLVLLFDSNNRLTQITGADRIPANQPGLPTSKDTRLNAAPL